MNSTLVQTRTMTVPKLRDSDALLSKDVRSFFKILPKPGRPKKRPRGPAPAPPPHTGPLPAAARKTKPAIVKTKKPKVKMHGQDELGAAGQPGDSAAGD